MATLSLAMIVKNEAKLLPRILADAKTFCDELIVLDTGSTDDSVAVAESMGAQVFHFEWVDDFAAARNASFSYCTGDWIIWLDADDTVSEADQAGIRHLKETVMEDLRIDAIFLMYQYRFTPNGECVFSFMRERILRRAAKPVWEFPVHECISIPANRAAKVTNIAIQHRPPESKYAAKEGRNLRILEQALAKGDRSLRNLFYYGNELRDNKRYEEAIVAYDEYIAASPVVWEKYSATLSIARCLNHLGRQDEVPTRCRQAILLDASRAEAFNMLGLYYYKQERWAEAIPFFEAALSLPKPDTGFVNDGDYAWIPHDLLGVCFDRLGQHQKAVAHTMKAIPGNPEKERIIKNLHWLIDQL